MSDYRLDAYYYGFEPTKNAAINKILGAVACAGKAYHHTQDWDEEVSPYDDHTGKTPTEWIQNAAIEAADEIELLQTQVAALREALEPFVAAYSDYLDSYEPDEFSADDCTADAIYQWALHVTWGDLRRARAALATGGDE